MEKEGADCSRASAGTARPFPLWAQDSGLRESANYNPRNLQTNNGLPWDCPYKFNSVPTNRFPTAHKTVYEARIVGAPAGTATPFPLRGQMSGLRESASTIRAR